MSATEIIPIYDHTVPLAPVQGNTPWGLYDDDPKFIADAPNFVKFAARRLGYPIARVELQDINFYACLEEAVSTYGKELYEYKIRENFLSMEGASTGSTSINNTLIQPNLGNIIRLAQDYGSEAGSGGNVNYYSGSIPMQLGQQFYDLNAWASQSAVIEPGDAIEIKRVFYEAPPAITRYFQPYFGAGISSNFMGGFFGGMDQFSPNMNYMLMPIYADVLRVQQIEFNDQIRRSGYSFEIQNNRIRIFPIPAFERTLWFTYIKKSERNSISRGGDTSGLISNVSNVPYQHPRYSLINFPSAKWIWNYGLSLCKETLGNIRLKYTTIPIPGQEISLNGQTLMEQAQREMDALILQLRDTLDATSRDKQLERRKLEADNMGSILNGIPNVIYIA